MKKTIPFKILLTGIVVTLFSASFSTQVFSQSGVCYQDLDRDGYGDSGDPGAGIPDISFCTAVNQYSVNNDDCNDNDASVYLGASELCDGIDNNCDGIVDEGCPINNTPTADAGLDKSANANEVVTLDGSASTDPDGDPLEYSWRALPTNEVICTASNNPLCEVIVMGYAEEVFELTVIDNFGASDTDTVSIFNPVIVGSTGPAGADGNDGFNSLIDFDSEIGSSCDSFGNGGIRVRAGIDDDRDGTLDAEEVDVVQYLCNGADGLQGPQGEAGVSQDLTDIWQKVNENRMLLEQLPMLKKELEALQNQIAQ